jgi:FAD/FMN-containing dehydrogenase
MTLDTLARDTSVTVSPAALHDLARAVRGQVLAPTHPDFEATAAVWNLAAQGRPAAIVRPAGTEDVVRAIAFARENGLELAVRGGGHSVAGHSTGEGVLVIDTRGLRDLEIDPVGRRARAGAGLTAGEYTARAHELGLATPFGDTASVGITGLTLGGGIGFLARRDGLTIDSLVSAEVVTADGRVVTASAQSNPDLFWALRGGGGNFGVVTSLELDLHPAGIVRGGALLLPATRDVLRGLAPIAAEAPADLTIIANLMPAPPAPFVPEGLVGTPVVAVLGVQAGDAVGAADAFAPLRALARPLVDTVGLIPYPVIYQYTASASIPHASVVRTSFLDAVTDGVVDALLDGYERSTALQSIVQLRVLGGAVAAVAPDATAFAHRQAPVMVGIMAAAESPDDLPPSVAWADEVLGDLRGHRTGAYVNFVADEGDARIREAYPESTYARLAAVKADWDPDNMFRRNQNIRPGAAD